MSDLIEADFGEFTLAIFQYGDCEDMRNTATYIQSERLRCPVFRMWPEAISNRTGAAIGFQDIDFESHPEFSQMFVLKGADETAVRDYLHPGQISCSS